MRATSKRLRIPLRMRARVIALVPAVWALAAVATSPVGAELALADGPSAARSATVVYGGTTSNGWPVVADVTRDGRMIKRIVGAIPVHCSEGGDFSLPSQWRYLRVSRAGAFKASYENKDVEEGVEMTVSERLAGKLNSARTRISATWSLSMTFKNPDGTVDVCDSGTLKVTLRR
jgi:hypothetical protein